MIGFYELKYFFLNSFRVLFFLIFLKVSQVNAETFLTCEVIRVKGDYKTLKLKEYPNSFETIIVDRKKKLITRLYKIADKQMKYEYQITNSSTKYLVGVEKFSPDWVSIITVNLENKVFNTYYGGYGGTSNTLSVGQCS